MHIVLHPSHYDTQGRHYPSSLWYVRKGDTAPGWFIYGRASNVSAHVVTCVSRPTNVYVKHPNYNGKVCKGWKTRRAATEALAALLLSPDATPRP